MSISTIATADIFFEEKTVSFSYPLCQNIKYISIPYYIEKEEKIKENRIANGCGVRYETTTHYTLG